MRATMWIHVLVTLAAVIGWDQAHGSDPNEHSWMLFPGGDGQPHLALLTGGVPVEVQRASENVAFYFYSKENPNQAVQIEAENLKVTQFKPARRTKFIIHGYASSSETSWVVRMKNALLAHEECQVIVVDWAPLAQPPLYNYVAERYAERVGWMLADLMRSLTQQFGANQLDNFHLVGHSLGAHLAGFAGKHVNVMTGGGNVSRITALDPALPLFDKPSKRLRAENANFVDVIHAGAGWLGIDDSLGHADFFPNGGANQPGCDADYSGCCSHNRAVEYFIESIETDLFRALQCDSYSTYANNLCSSNSCFNMGNYLDHSARGNFYLVTSSKSPFALG